MPAPEFVVDWDGVIFEQLRESSSQFAASTTEFNVVESGSVMRNFMGT